MTMMLHNLFAHALVPILALTGIVAAFVWTATR